MHNRLFFTVICFLTFSLIVKYQITLCSLLQNGRINEKRVIRAKIFSNNCVIVSWTNISIYQRIGTYNVAHITPDWNTTNQIKKIHKCRLVFVAGNAGIISQLYNQLLILILYTEKNARIARKPLAISLKGISIVDEYYALTLF